MQRALAIREQQLGADQPDTASSLNNLAMLYRAGEVCRSGAALPASPGHQRAAVDPGHPDTAIASTA